MNPRHPPGPPAASVGGLVMVTMAPGNPGAALGTPGIAILFVPCRS